MSQTPFISIIIPVRNAERTLDTTFQYLDNIKYPQDKMEWLIADGGSTDGTITVIEQWQKTHQYIQLVEAPNSPSPGYARNIALDVAKGKFIFFTDGDCAPCENWISEMLGHFYRDPKIGAVGGEIYTLRVDESNLTELYCENFGFNRVSWRYGNLQEGYLPRLTDRSATEIAGHRAYFFVTANVAYRREAIENSNARFWTNPTGEDIEFGLQVQAQGWLFYFAPQARVDHMHRSTFQALRKVWVTYGQGHGPLVARHATQHLDIVFQCLKNTPRVKIPSPLKGFMYIGNFHVMHIMATIGIISLIRALSIPGALCALIISFLSFAIAIKCFYAFALHCYYMQPRKHFFTWLKMKYLTNLSFIIGGLKTFKRDKVLCVEPSF